MHAGIFSNPDEHIFLQDVADELIYKTPQKGRHKKNHCCDCGAEIWVGSVRCKECANKHSQSVDRPTREKLISLLKEYTLTEIGRIYDVDSNSVRKWCIKYGLPSRAMDINGMTESDWLSIEMQETKE